VRKENPLRTLTLIGAGPVGVAAARAALEEEVVSAVAVIVDIDPAARDAAAEELQAPACADLPGCAGLSSLALVAFSSRLVPTLEVIEELVGRGASVVTTCEELSNPPEAVGHALDEVARTAGRVVIATGANPGFVMDRLPLLAAGGVRDPRQIEVVRRVDTSLRRGPLVAKTGRGLTEEEFRQGVSRGTVGHAGLDVSARLVADGLGWSIEKEVSTIEPAVVDGVVTGVHQTHTIEAGQGCRLHYELTMAWELSDPFDRIRINGATPLVVEIPGGYHGDLGTTARTLNALRATEHLRAGFYRPIDLPIGW